MNEIPRALMYPLGLPLFVSYMYVCWSICVRVDPYVRICMYVRAWVHLCLSVCIRASFYAWGWVGASVSCCSMPAGDIKLECNFF